MASLRQMYYIRHFIKFQFHVTIFDIIIIDTLILFTICMFYYYRFNTLGLGLDVYITLLKYNLLLKQVQSSVVLLIAPSIFNQKMDNIDR